MTQQPLVGRYRRFAIIFRLNTLGRAPVWTSDQHVTGSLHNTHKRQTSMTTEGFEPAIPGRNDPQTHTLDRAVTDIGNCNNTSTITVTIIVTRSSSSNYKN